MNEQTRTDNLKTDPCRHRHVLLEKDAKAYNYEKTSSSTNGPVKTTSTCRRLKLYPLSLTLYETQFKVD
jgi:hypothetical protein